MSYKQGAGRTRLGSDTATNINSTLLLATTSFSIAFPRATFSARVLNACRTLYSWSLSLLVVSCTSAIQNHVELRTGAGTRFKSFPLSRALHALGGMAKSTPPPC